MNVLLSIKPAFARRIFDGTKRYEYRRLLFKRPVDKVIVYASAPTSKIIGEFDIHDLLFHDLDTLWRKTEKYSGISEEYFYSYFCNREHGYAIQIGHAVEYRHPKALQDVYGLRPPQSYAYVASAV